MNFKSVKFTAAQRIAVTAFINAQLAATQVTPKLKAPLIAQAKALGFSEREGQAIAARTIKKFRARAYRKADAAYTAAEAKAAKATRLHQTLACAVADQAFCMQPMSDREITALVQAGGLRGKKSEVAAARLRLIAMQAVATYNIFYRTCKHGTVTAQARANKRGAPVTPGVGQTTSTDWNLYRGEFKGWAATVLDTDLTLRADYWSKVEQTTGAVVEDCLMLDASPVRGMENLFHATWIQQGRGNQVSLVAGFVATGTAGAALGATAEQAMAKYAKQLKKAA